MRPSLITPPASEPVSLAELKLHARVDFGDDDTTLQALLDAAVAHLDGYSGVLGRCLISQTWKQTYRDWCGRFRLPFPDASSVVVKYFDADGAEQTVSSSLYEIVDGEKGSEVVFKDAFTEPSLDDDRDAPVSVEFVAGYGDADAVPAALKVAIMMLAAHWYQNREAVLVDAPKSVPLGFDALTEPYRRVGV